MRRSRPVRSGGARPSGGVVPALDVPARYHDDTGDPDGLQVTPRPTGPQRRILERLDAGSVVRLPPWSKRIQLIAVGEQTQYLSTPTFRALLRHGWIVRASGPADQVSSYRLSEAGKLILEPLPER
jgi:hypothetical protein